MYHKLTGRLIVMLTIIYALSYFVPNLVAVANDKAVEEDIRYLTEYFGDYVIASSTDNKERPRKEFSPSEWNQRYGSLDITAVAKISEMMIAGN